MQVIKDHRARTAQLAENLRSLLEMERALFDLRSKSWELQIAGTQSREADLEAVHASIEQKMIEVENLRQVLTVPKSASSGQPL